MRRLHENAERYSSALRRLGFDLLKTTTPIVPIMCRTELMTYKMTRLCQANGVFVLPIVYPAVPSEHSETPYDGDGRHIATRTSISRFPFLREPAVNADSSFEHAKTDGAMGGARGPLGVCFAVAYHTVPLPGSCTVTLCQSGRCPDPRPATLAAEPQGY